VAPPGAPVASINFTGVKFVTGEEISETPVVRVDSSAAAAHDCAAGPVWPLPDKYALATDERTTDEICIICI